MNFTEEKWFLVGMWWRIGYGFLRIILGLVTLNFIGTPLIDVITVLMGHERVEDPNDILFVFVSQLLAGHPLYISYFIAFHFIFWGVVDIVLSYNLIKYRLWAFPVSLSLIGIFILYEMVRFSYTHSIILLGVMCVDLVVVWLVWREYKRLCIRRAEG